MSERGGLTEAERLALSDLTDSWFLSTKDIDTIDRELFAAVEAIIAARVQQAEAGALREAADEVHREARWQAEQKARLAAVSDLRAGVQYNASLQRLAVLEQILTDRADRIDAGTGGAG